MSSQIIISKIVIFAILFTGLVTSFQLPNPVQIVSRDFQALTRRVTAYHILLPKSMDVSLALKQKIRNAVTPKKGSDIKPMYVVDAFSRAAMKYSKDEDTASRGGLLGKLVSQGYCRASELDKACFEVPLGEIAGPIESEYGFHLLLVTERTNCPKLDGKYTRIARGDDGTSTTRLMLDESSSINRNDIAKLAFQQLGFWVAVTLAGGVVAEIAAKAANIVGTVPWE